MGLLKTRWKRVSLVREYVGYRYDNRVSVTLKDEVFELEFEEAHINKVLGDKREVLVTETRRLAFGKPHYSIAPHVHRVPTQEEIEEAVKWAEETTPE